MLRGSPFHNPRKEFYHLLTLPALCVCILIFILDFTKSKDTVLVENRVCLNMDSITIC